MVAEDLRARTSHGARFPPRVFPESPPSRTLTEVSSPRARALLWSASSIPPCQAVRKRHARYLAFALVGRGHQVVVATISSGGRVGTQRRRQGEGSPPAIQRPAVSEDLQRDGKAARYPRRRPSLRAQIRALVSSRAYDVLHAHDWIVNSVLGAAGRGGPPVVYTMHDYSHVCATKRMMPGTPACPGPEPAACVRCASAMYGPVMGPGVYVANTIQAPDGGHMGHVSLRSSPSALPSPKARLSIRLSTASRSRTSCPIPS